MAAGSFRSLTLNLQFCPPFLPPELTILQVKFSAPILQETAAREKERAEK